MGFSRQEYWSGQPLPPPGDLPDPGIEPGSPCCRQILYLLSHQSAEQGPKETWQPLCFSRNAADVLPDVPQSLHAAGTEVRWEALPTPCMITPLATGASNSQRLLSQAGEKGFVLCHFPPKKLFPETKWLSLHQMQFFTALFCKRRRTGRWERRWGEK